MNEHWTPHWRSEGFAEDLPEVAAPMPVRPGTRRAGWLLAVAPLLVAVAGLAGALLA